MDEVLRGQRLEHGNNELDGEFTLAELLFEEEELVREYDLAVHVLQEDPECLTVSVDLLIPLEVRSESELHPELRPDDVLDVAYQLLLGELMDVLVDGLAELRHHDQFTELSRSEIVKSLLGKFFFMIILTTSFLNCPRGDML